MGKLVRVETEHVKVGRFEAFVTKKFYDGPEEREAQVKALRRIKSLIGRETQEDAKNV